MCSMQFIYIVCICWQVQVIKETISDALQVKVIVHTTHAKPHTTVIGTHSS